MTSTWTTSQLKNLTAWLKEQLQLRAEDQSAVEKFLAHHKSLIAEVNLDNINNDADIDGLGGQLLTLNFLASRASGPPFACWSPTDQTQGDDGSDGQQLSSRHTPSNQHAQTNTNRMTSTWTTSQLKNFISWLKEQQRLRAEDQSAVEKFLAHHKSLLTEVNLDNINNDADIDNLGDHQKNILAALALIASSSSEFACWSPPNQTQGDDGGDGQQLSSRHVPVPSNQHAFRDEDDDNTSTGIQPLESNDGGSDSSGYNAGASSSSEPDYRDVSHRQQVDSDDQTVVSESSLPEGTSGGEIIELQELPPALED